MCVAASRSSLPQTPVVAPAPTRDAATITADPTALVNQNKALVAKRQGVFGNVRTTPFGDASYGTAAVARFGARAA